jgi:hypothetical protein
MDLAEISVGILRSLCRLLKIPETRKQFPVMYSTQLYPVMFTLVAFEMQLQYSTVLMALIKLLPTGIRSKE